MTSNLTPITTQERIHSLDILRGFSLLGIFLVNMITFHSPFSYYNPYEWWQYGDLTVYMWLDILVQASFYPIFAMMFGYGMVIMQERSLAKGVSFNKISIRRLLVLLAFGIIHAFFIWHGDILITYAIMGLLLLLLLRLSGPMLLILGGTIYLIPQIFLSGLMLIVSLVDTASLADFTDVMGIENAVAAYTNGSYWEITQQRAIDWSAGNGIAGFVLYIFMILPLMMLGAGAAKCKWLENAKKLKKMWITFLLVCLPVGLLVKSLPLMIGTSIGIQYIQDMIGGPILAIGYIALIVLVTMKDKILELLQPLAAAGKMSITIYLTQSIIGTLIFYHYGLGLYGKVSMATGTWLAIGIYVIQVVLALIWLSKFKYGPVEKLWRTLTYGRLK